MFIKNLHFTCIFMNIFYVYAFIKNFKLDFDSKCNSPFLPLDQ